ncbi:GGDEF domain-containing protein [Modicisalibacter tunisiensis]|uniref:sensor domain-containing diguanylate cyclase n=1 Tax=Modicisalibacter tunisiensis TaxID=390637 RepID=UPI001CCE7D15|nr:GGDEF domain-containing protein [Modicisalibacter tunisiensis]MBZ9540225.1 GGDEF domain-containing protein [Modicisalibacter tunisiensis]
MMTGNGKSSRLARRKFNRPALPGCEASLRSYLTLWFAGLSLFTLLVVGVYVGHIATEQVKEASGRVLANAARTTAFMLGVQLRERQQEISLLSRDPLLVRGDLDDPSILRSMELRSQSRAEYAWMGVADASGRVRQAVDGVLQGQSVETRPWFQAGLRGPYMGDPHEALLLAKLLPFNANGEPLRFIDFAAPITDDAGRVIGVLGAHAHWRWVRSVIESSSLLTDTPPGMQVLVVNQDGLVLYPEKLAEQQKTLHLDVTEGPAWSVDKTYLRSVAPVSTPLNSGLSWSIVVRQPLTTALRPARTLLYKLLGLGVLAALLFAVAAYYLARSLSRPIEQLAGAARRIQSHRADVSFPLHHPVREISQLGQSLQNMTDSLLGKERELQEANASLEATVEQRTAALTQANAELLQLATHDSLTGVHNRRCLDEKLEEYRQLFLRTDRGFALLLLDVDHFKPINDTYGHATGDDVLVKLAQMIQLNTRATDFVARYGGEEFAVVLPYSEGEQGPQVVAQKICDHIATATFDAVGKVTVSIGVALAHVSDPDTVTLIDRADQQLYRAKQLGRNQVAFAG